MSTIQLLHVLFFLLAHTELMKFSLQELSLTWITNDNKHSIRTVIYQGWYYALQYLCISLYQIKSSFTLYLPYTRSNYYHLRIKCHAEIYRGYDCIMYVY